MLRLLVFATFISLGHFADHDTFKNCSRVNFCNTLRDRQPLDKYAVDASTLVIDDNGNVTVTLKAKEGSDLQLELLALVDRTFRLRIKEVDSTRYELKDVLVSEPQLAHIDSVMQQDNYVTIQVGETTAQIFYDPFIVNFYLVQVHQVVIEGSSLTFDKSLDQAFAFNVKFPSALQLYGLHEHADSLALQNTGTNGTDPYRLRNLDVAGYELDSPMSLYGAVPVLYGWGTYSHAGVFLHNAAEQWYDITNGKWETQANIMVESGMFDLFVMIGPSPDDLVHRYLGLTGTFRLPQLWTLGYHQSRWSYMSQEDVKDVVANFTTNNFPLDVIWLDVDYTDGKKYFTWDPKTYSDPVEMQKNISAAYKRLVAIIDPHIKVEKGYNVYDGALEKGYFVKRSNGSVFEGDCWPGLSSYVDFLNPDARQYYGSFYSYDNFPSSTPVLAGIWNDMNEPSVFDNSIEKTLPGDALHFGDVAHRDIHNIYGLLHTMSTHQGLLNRDNGTNRPFILTRSHFAGTQRYSAIWTGDNTADWGYLSVSYDSCLDANLLGLVFCGADVGGFSGNPDTELLQRWYQAGAWLPFYRAHSSEGTERREPYLFDSGVQDVIRSAIQLRYKHLPVWYTLFYEHERNRDPVIRPLFYHYSYELETFSLRNHLLVGRDILVRAVAEPGVETVTVHFPGGQYEHWMSLDGTEVYEGTTDVDIPVDIKSIPVYYRVGSVIVRKDTLRLSTDEMINDGYTIYANLDRRNQSSGTVYLDDFTSYNYANNKQYNYLRIDVDDVNVSLTKIDEDSNPDGFDFIIDEVVVHRIVQEPQNGKPGRYEKQIYRTDANGQLLKKLKFKYDEPIYINLGL
ncbi:neutral alpha-glucosidase C-like [Tribolium madens]|uniref:neutral alpha-glucosidase C-like n=1 Tax=Tribolium madens TaxID=41895 RepID=UPI001CF7525C|nr:neutral alpha-glucosidase C-like [Tribolium madens]